MTALIHLVSLSMSLHLCCLKSLTLLQVWLYSRTSKSISMGDVWSMHMGGATMPNRCLIRNVC
jgi:hypothetical protein